MRSLHCQTIAAEETSRERFLREIDAKDCQDNVPAVDCRKYKDITRNGGFDEFPIVLLKKVQIELGKNFLWHFFSLSRNNKILCDKPSMCNTYYMLIRSKCYVPRGVSPFRDKWLVICSETKTFIVNNIASIYPRINIREIETKNSVCFRRNERKSNWSFDVNWRSERIAGGRDGKGKKVRQK